MVGVVIGLGHRLSAEPIPGTKTVSLPVRMESRMLAPADLRDADGRLGTVTAYVRGGKIEGSERTKIRLRVDGVTVTVEFGLRSVVHAERTLGFQAVTHEYAMGMLRFQHGYRQLQDGAYSWDSDSDDGHAAAAVMDTKTGKELDAFLQRSVEMWVDRALSLILLSLEQDYKKSL